MTEEAFGLTQAEKIRLAWFASETTMREVLGALRQHGPGEITAMLGRCLVFDYTLPRTEPLPTWAELASLLTGFGSCTEDLRVDGNQVFVIMKSGAQMAADVAAHAEPEQPGGV